MNIVANQEAEFSGRYIAHWEVERIEIEVGRRFFGLFPKSEAWQPTFPPGFDLPNQNKYQANWSRHPGRRFLIRFIGVPTAMGRFAHMGMCRRQVEIRKVIELEEIS